MAQRLRSELLHPSKTTQFFNMPFNDWFHYNLCAEWGDGRISWNTIFGVACWSSLWLWRNQFIFQGMAFPNAASEHVLRYVKGIVEAYTTANLGSTKKQRVERNIARHSPPFVFIKINADGSVMSSQGPAAAGGLLRDHCGNWLGGFSANLGNCSVFRAETWGVDRKSVV